MKKLNSPLKIKKVDAKVSKVEGALSFLKGQNFLAFLCIALSFAITTYFLYQSSIPQTYTYVAGDVSTEDIFLPRPIVNMSATEEQARKVADSVADIYTIDEDVVKENELRLTNFIQKFLEIRLQVYAALLEKQGDALPSTYTAQEVLELTDAAWKVQTLKLEEWVEQLVQETKIDDQRVLTDDEAKILLQSPPSVLKVSLERLSKISEELNQTLLDFSGLSTAFFQLKHQLNLQSELQYKEVTLSLYNVLQKTQQVNASFNAEKTKTAKESAYKTALTNTIYYEKQTRIVEKGEVLSQKKIELLSLAGLLEKNHVDYSTLLSTVVFLFLIYAIGLLYVNFSTQTALKSLRARLVLLFLLQSIFVAFALFFRLEIATFPILLSCILMAYYFNSRDAIVYSLLFVFSIFPLTAFSYEFLFVSFISVLALSLSVKALSGRDHYALLILISSFVPPLTFSVLGFMLKLNTKDIFNQALVYLLVGIFSAITAIGTMPLLEVLLDALSPLRLLALSNQNQILLRRLFNEARGTYHHSLMVAALAEVAAEKIGADPLLVRVGALYHDIGKLESPLMFTENQEGENPHDHLDPEMSAKIILGHVKKGLAMAEDFRLPKRLHDFIAEHHGTQHLMMFYKKACEKAEQEGKELPDKAIFTYMGPAPRSKETAVLMMADSIEAAMKSTGYKDLENAEKLMRNIIKTKFEQQQFLNSGLTFADVEACIQAFLNVYAGQFKERVKYNLNENHRS